MSQCFNIFSGKFDQWCHMLAVPIGKTLESPLHLVANYHGVTIEDCQVYHKEDRKQRFLSKSTPISEFGFMVDVVELRLQRPWKVIYICIILFI